MNSGKPQDLGPHGSKSCRRGSTSTASTKRSPGWTDQLDSKFAQPVRKLDKLTWMTGFALAGIVTIIARLLRLGP